MICVDSSGVNLTEISNFQRSQPVIETNHAPLVGEEEKQKKKWFCQLSLKSKFAIGKKSIQKLTFGALALRKSNLSTE